MEHPARPDPALARLLPAPELRAACERHGLPGLVPSPAQSLAAVPELVLRELDQADRGVIVLAVDGLPEASAAGCWRSARLGCLTSTFPTVSAPAWLTALTGADAGSHGVPGMVYRLPGRGLVNGVTGRPLDGADPAEADGRDRVAAGQDRAAAAGRPAADAVGAALPTLFERARDRGARPVAVGRELDWLTGPWAPALLRGAGQPLARGTAEERLRAEASAPPALVTAVAADVERVLAGCPPVPPALVWVYVNLDDHLHQHGCDGAALDAMVQLDRHAVSWADRGWTVVGHSDHGHLGCVRDPDVEHGWAEVETAELCELPAGGAGRVRWLHPRPGRAEEVAGRLAAALGDAALVLPLDEVGGLGLLRLTPLLRSRLGSVVAIAASDRFPLPDPRLRWEHGSISAEEMLVPFATWRP